jgi:ABC-2 type transport system ATP-binding protein
VSGFDHIENYREVRKMIGLVPQELTTDMFEKVVDTVIFSRGLFGLQPNKSYIEKILEDLSLSDKRNNQIKALSGGMKRRVMIAKALAHEPTILFLDEPTAGVDVKLRESMWESVAQLRKNGVTIILTTHYIEEAEKMADRIGIINKGKIILVEETKTLMKKLGKKELIFSFVEKINSIPESLTGFNLRRDGDNFIYSYNENAEIEDCEQSSGRVAERTSSRLRRTNDRSVLWVHEDHEDDENAEIGVPLHARNGLNSLIKAINDLGISFKDLETKQTSLEDIFVQLVE